MSADISSDTSRLTYRPTLDRRLSKCRPRGAQNTHDPWFFLQVISWVSLPDDILALLVFYLPVNREGLQLNNKEIKSLPF